MEKELEYLVYQFEVLDIKNFCKRYDLGYDHLRRVLKGDKELTEKKFTEYKEALQKHKSEI